MRMRFNRAEREAFTVGTHVEWRNGRHWHPGVITGPIRKDSHGSGFQHIPIRNLSRRGGAPYGDDLIMSPTHVRIPQD